MAIIIDADVIIRGERGTFDLKGWLAAQAGGDFEVAAITVAELWHGIERAIPTHRARRERFVRTILESMSIIPYTERTAREHASIWASLESAGKITGPYDLIVAATAVERNSRLATFNRRHFENVRGLSIIEPTFPGLRQNKN
jgi:tRNA(fMet)-specific endonuclease VapC